MSPDWDLLWTSGTLVPGGGNDQSGWVSVKGAETLRISRNVAGGAYAFEIDWSRDGVSVDLTEAVTTVEDDSIEQPVAAQFARFRVRNTDALMAFSAHRTNVYAFG